ncbi:NAD(P)/FAD-dependent oxidoreductase [Rhizosphaericola mali]|uniref:NADH:ubiquinone reductase (non-electrogenic) n=1 Tax=Rhizosphaericola mali TaxID=2545455 RepID=A0A5P2G4M2_9BACT|nr:NAD(P)/FAD-dependent oxidoreductase [Rhizosphaericola mali]QES90776.1 NAD(P)/FAD-dependent oxidoreductase [Rhizosphaericola mali]
MPLFSGISLNIPDTDKPRVVIIGGGFGGLYAAHNLDSSKFQIVLFDKRNYHTFQPLLYQVATAGLQADAIAGPLRTTFKKKKNFFFRLLRVQKIDPDEKLVFTSSGSLHYDYLIIANGCRSNFYGDEMMEKFSFPMKSIPDALNLRSQLMQTFEMAGLVKDPAKQRDLLSIVIVGGGPTGVETAGALSELRKHVLPKDYPDVDFSNMHIHLVQSGNFLLAGMAEKSCKRAYADLTKMGVEVILNSKVSSYDGYTATLTNGQTIATSTLIWSAGVKGDVIPGLKPEWIDHNKLVVDNHCKVVGSDGIFALGDIAILRTDKYPNGLPGVAQPAIQMGTYVGKNLCKIQNNEPLKDFKYFDKGSLATIGKGKAVCDLPNKKAFGGLLAWMIWAFVHITFLVSFKNRVKVFINWVWNYLTYDTGNRLIIRPYIRTNDRVAEKIVKDNEYSS